MAEDSELLLDVREPHLEAHVGESRYDRCWPHLGAKALEAIILNILERYGRDALSQELGWRDQRSWKKCQVTRAIHLEQLSRAIT